MQSGLKLLDCFDIMGLSRSGPRQHEGAVKLRDDEVTAGQNQQRLVACKPALEGCADYSLVDLIDATRISFMLTPKGRGPFRQQLGELLAAMHALLKQQEQPAAVVIQTVFLRNASDRQECERILAHHYGSRAPVTNFVFQPPCCCAALALEAWAIAGPSARVEHFGSHAIAVSYDSVRWVYCAGIHSANATRGAYSSSMGVLKKMEEVLTKAGTGFEHVVRTWFYLGGITEPEGITQRYKELNRARTDFYRGIRFCRSLSEPMIPHGIFPASTGIGTMGMGLVGSCLSLQTRRKDAFLVPLENPRQTPAYAYPPRYSPQSPKFSRGMALLLGAHAITWVSGTASVVNSASCHAGDIEKQTEQAIANIERLIAADNFAFHGVNGAGADLRDFAKIRVYLKHLEHFPICRAICESHFGGVPAIYAVADICRPELLVEIEGVAFSRNSKIPGH